MLLGTPRVLEGSNLSPNEIDVGHRTWPRSVSTEPFRVEPVGIKVSVKVILSFAPSEEEENENYDGEETDGTSDDTTGDGRGIRSRRRRSTRVLRLRRGDELGGLHCLRLDLAVRISGPSVERKASGAVLDSETKNETYTTTVLKTDVEVDEPGPGVVEVDAPPPPARVEVVDGVGEVPGVVEVVEGVGVTGSGVVLLVVEGGTSEVVVGGSEVVEGGSLVEDGRVAAGG